MLRVNRAPQALKAKSDTQLFGSRIATTEKRPKFESPLQDLQNAPPTKRLIDEEKYFTARFSPVHRPGPAHYILADVNEPLRLLTEHRYANRDRNTLWWYVEKAAVSPKAIVRNHCANKIRHTFVEALKAHGYAKDGKPAAADAEDAPKKEPLRGFLRLQARPAVVTGKGTDIRKQCFAVVEAIVAHRDKLDRPLDTRQPNLDRKRDFGNRPSTRERKPNPHDSRAVFTPSKSKKPKKP